MKLTVAVANHQANGVARMLDGGSIRLLDANGDLLAEPRFAAEAFEPAADGRAVAKPILSDPDAAKTGKAVEYVLVTAAGEVVGKGKAASKPAEGVTLVLKSQTIQKHAEVMIDSFALRAV